MPKRISSDIIEFHTSKELEPEYVATRVCGVLLGSNHEWWIQGDGNEKTYHFGQNNWWMHISESTLTDKNTFMLHSRYSQDRHVMKALKLILSQFIFK